MTEDEGQREEVWQRLKRTLPLGGGREIRTELGRREKEEEDIQHNTHEYPFILLRTERGKIHKKCCHTTNTHTSSVESVMGIKLLLRRRSVEY